MISLQELSLAKRKLEKYAKDKKEEPKMTAILNALVDFSVNKEILISSDITTILRDIKKTYVDSDAGKEAKNILIKWRKQVEAEEENANVKTTESTTTTSEGINDDDRPSKKLRVSTSEDALANTSETKVSPKNTSDPSEWKQSKYDCLSETRKKVRFFSLLLFKLMFAY